MEKEDKVAIIFMRITLFSVAQGKRGPESLMNFYKDDEIKAIFDISGGDIANEILPFLNFQTIAKCKKSFWGYSDLTTVINAIFAKTGKKSVLYQVRNIISADAENQLANFTNTILNDRMDLFSFNYELVQKEEVKGVVVGGNIRCLLKLAGTQFWPDMNGKVLLLEALGGAIPQMVTYLNQLKQIDVFDRINGILLGTFSKMEEESGSQMIIDLVRQYVGTDLPIAKTNEIGHGANSKGIVIGEEIYLKRNK